MAVDNLVRMETPPAANGKTFCEFFAGIGLVHEALRGGWTCCYAGDIDARKAAMYRSHFGSAEYYHVGDVWRTEEVLRRIERPPLLATASFPCTDMSLAGQMRGFRGRESSAFFGFLEVLARLEEERPPLVMLENVTGFLTSHGGADFRGAVEALADLGYWIDALVLDARDFVPQSRPRLFVLGFHQRQAWEGLVRQERGANPSANSWRQTLAEIPKLRPERLRRAMETIDLPTGWAALPLPAPPSAQHDLATHLDLDDDQPWWDAAQTDRHVAMMSPRHRAAVDRAVHSGQSLAATVYRRIRQGEQRAEVRLDGLAGCLRTPRGGSARQIVLWVSEGRIRMRWMTPREYARLQGAPDFPIASGVNQALFGFGDAVCVPVIRWIDQHVLSPLAEEALAAV